MNWLGIRIINLEHRQDRRLEATREMQRAGISSDSYSFITAKYDPELPSRGCAASHAYALAEFLFTSTAPYALILEDDFRISDLSAFLDIIASLERNTEPWDVLLLAHNRAVPMAPTRAPNRWRVINAKTTSAYVTSRRYAPHLGAFFFGCADRLTETQHAPTETKTFALRNYCPDIAWHSLQSQNTFTAVFPPVITQRASFSDIQKTHVDYGV